MPERWTGQLVKLMHMNGITRIQLADKLSYTPEYVSMVLNGKRHPQNAEEVFRAALNALIAEKKKK